MLDLNHILLFIAIISPLAVLGRAWLPGHTSREWRIASLIVVMVTGVAWIFWRDYAGYIGGGAWFVLLFIPAVGLRQMVELATVHRFESARKLAQILLIFHPSRQLRDQIAIFRTLEKRQTSGLIPPPSLQTGSVFAKPFHRLRHAPVVVLIIVVNVVVFLFEVRLGVRTSVYPLYKMGALDFYSVAVRHEYWRTFTALFLHFDTTHLFFNLFALYILGPSLERVIGSFRFAGCYLLSGLGSSFGVLLLSWLHLVNLPGALVGASGCVMGIVGTWAGFLLRHRHLPQARERLGNIVLIIFVQFIFDLFTPQVSTTAHLCGLATGFLLGLTMGPRQKAA